MLQWPELWGRGASSLTMILESLVTNISMASKPTSPISTAILREIFLASLATLSGIFAGTVDLARM